MTERGGGGFTICLKTRRAAARGVLGMGVRKVGLKRNVEG